MSQSQASTPKCQKEHGGGRGGALGSPQELLHSGLAPPVETVVFIMLLAAANARQRLNNLQFFAWRLKAEHTSVRVLRVRVVSELTFS